MTDRRLRRGLLGVAGLGVAVAGYLELFVINAICQWCVASAIIMACAAALACWRLLIDPADREEPAAGRPDAGEARPMAQAGS